MKSTLKTIAACLLMLWSATAAAAAPAVQPMTEPDITASWQCLRPPQPKDFYMLKNAQGGYSLFLPKAFGDNPLASLPHANGPMQLRTKSEHLLCAINVQNPLDRLAYNATAPLPKLQNAEPLVRWQHGHALVWSCVLSRQNDYNGDRLYLQATAPANGKTYELLYVMPTKDYATLLAQALWSLNSFEIMKEK